MGIFSRRRVFGCIFSVGLITALLLLMRSTDYHKESVSQRASLTQSTLPVGSESAAIVYNGVVYPEEDLALEVARVKQNLDKCFQASDLSRNSTGHQNLEIQAKWNAEYFLREYRRIIPPNSMKGYSSYCWNSRYKAIAMGWFSHKIEGHIDGLYFKHKLDNIWYANNEYSDLSNYFGGRFSSEMVCLPKIYLLGFEKCGSTYFWCFIKNVLAGHHQTGNQDQSPRQLQADKEPYFWTPFDYKKSLPLASNLGNSYLINFMRAFDPRLSVEDKKRAVLIDGTPSMVLEWPSFKESDHERANHCLLPSALPQLFPESKYVVIMRNPVSMMYSSFWWSYVASSSFSLGYVYDLLHTSKGPTIFHKSVMAKLESFFECMRDETSPVTSKPCNISTSSNEEYESCIEGRTHLLSECVYSITTNRARLEAVLHRGIYHVHVRKWLSVLPKEQIMFTTLEKLKESPALVAGQLLKFFEVEESLLETPLSDDEVKRLTSTCSTNPSRIIDYAGNHKYDMHESTKMILTKFFQPFNKHLTSLLNDSQFLWSV